MYGAPVFAIDSDLDAGYSPMGEEIAPGFQSSVSCISFFRDCRLFLENYSPFSAMHPF